MNEKQMTPMVELAYNAVYAMIYEQGIRELPAERHLAGQVGVNRSTLRKALEQLTIDKHLVPAHGRRRRIIAKPNRPHSELLVGIVHMNNKTLAEAVRPRLQEKLYQTVEINMPIDARHYNAMKILPFPPLPLDGIIALATWPDPILRWLEQFPCPTILLDHASRSRRIVNLLPDERSTCRKFCRLLVKRGAEKVFYFDNIAESINPMRWEAFVAAATEFNLAIEGRVCDYLDQQKSLFSISNLLHKLDKGTGLFCAFQRTGWRIGLAMQQEGFRSPEDFYVICPDNARGGFPGGIQATAYTLDPDKSAVIAVTVLENLLSGKTESRKRRLLPTKIIPGGTL